MEERAVCFGPDSFGVHLSGRRNFLRLELLLRSPPSGEGLENYPDPFVRVRGESRLGALFLARLRSNDGALDRYVALKTLRDGRPSAGRRTLPDDPNPTQVRLFQEEYRALRLLREGDVDPVLRLAPFDLKTGGGVELPRQLPLFFCKRRRLFFSPRCSRCAEPLKDCQDDELLVRHGLKAYTTTNARYLHCPSCSREGAGGRFFTPQVDPSEPAGGRVGDARALLSSFGELARRGPTGITDFPCAECASTSSCHPASGDGEVTRVLVPFSFHDFFSFVVESLPLRFDDCCDLLGGRDPAEVLTRAEGVRSDSDFRGIPLFFRSDAEGRGPLEVLLLKLALCRELCLGVRSIHRRFERPHLNLRPDTVWAGTAGANLAFPGAWDLALRVTPPDQPVPEGDGAPAQPSYRWPAAPDPVYARERGEDAAAGRDFDFYAVCVLMLRALTGNRDQTGDTIAGALRGALAATSGVEVEARARAVLARMPAPMVSPSQLLWEPDEADSGVISPELWRRALLVALELSCCAEGQGGDEVLTRAVRLLADLEGEVRRSLFLDQPRRGMEMRQVLAELLDDDTWVSVVGAGPTPRPERREPVKTPSPPPPPPPPPPQEQAVDFEATVILGRAPAPKPTLPPSAPAAPSAPPAPVDFEATMIVGRGGVVPRPAPASPPPVQPPPSSETDFEATIISGRGPVRPTPPAPPIPEPPPPPSPEPSSGGFEETIILPAALRKGKGAGQR